MHSAIRITYPHRHNQDGSFDSICTICFTTVATEENEAKLRLYEMAHVCNPVEVYRVSHGCLPRSSTGRLD
jgi:hypothetical protein